MRNTEAIESIVISHVNTGHRTGQSPHGVAIRYGAARKRCVNDNDSTINERDCANVAEASGITTLDGQRRRIPVLGEAWDPIRYAAVQSNSIEEHGGCLSRTLWKVLNCFVLDKPLQHQ